MLQFRTRNAAGCRRCDRCSKRWLAPPRRCAAPTGMPTPRASSTRCRRPMAAESPTIAALSRALEAREVTSEALTERCLEQIAEREPSINAFIMVLADQAREQARAADRDLAAGRRRGPLHGIPLSLKDLIDVRGTPTTAASRVRQAHVATEDAAIVRRLRDAGAVIIGKTNLHEFALGTTNEDSAFGPVRHPLDANRSPGGSSGGSA